MPKHDFSALRSHYPEIIAQMPEVFTSHEFILALGQKYQVEYVCALYDYRDSLHGETPAPFMMVHARLAGMLRDFPTLVEFVRDDTASKDIFGSCNTCAQWCRLN